MNALIATALKHRLLMVGLFVLTIIGGLIAFRQLNIEAYPDPTPPMVTIITQSQGLSAEEIERYITVPIEKQVAGIKHLRNIRTISLYSLSSVNLQFTFDYTYEEALQQVLNRLASLPPLLNNAQPHISPISPIGEIFRYKLVGPANYSVLDLKTLQDWVLERRFRMVPGVIDVVGWGGKTKTFELQVDTNKLLAYGLTLPQVLQTLGNSNINVGGNTVNIGTQSAVVRGVGLIRSIDDISNTMLTQSGGNPVLVRDVAIVRVGHQPRLGIAGKDADDDIVQGIVLMRRGEQSMATIKRVQEEVERINDAGVLPPGVRIERIYDRKDLIDVTTRTVLHNMLFGIALIVLLQWVFLGNLRSAAIVGATIPFALLFAVGILVLRGEFRQSSLGRRDRLRPDRGFDGHHGRGDLSLARSAVRATRAGHARRARLGLVRQAPRNLPRRKQRRPLDLLFRRNHHRGVHPAIHAERGRGPHLRSDGEDLCLCARRRPDRDVHRDAGAQRISAARPGGGTGNLDRADAERRLHPGASLRARQSHGHPGRRDRAADPRDVCRADARP